MSPNERVLADRYAQALFDAAQAKGEGDRVRKDLGEAARKLTGGEAKMFLHPLISVEEKQKAVRNLLPSASSFTHRFLDLLIEKKRWGLLQAAAAGFDRIHDKAGGVLRAQVRAARALDQAQTERLRSGLEKFSGKKVLLEVREDPGLLGGAVVRMGDWVLDASLSNRLARLKDRMVEGETV